MDVQERIAHKIVFLHVAALRHRLTIDQRGEDGDMALALHSVQPKI